MDNALINVNGNNIQSLEILFMMTVIALLPSIVIMMTSFTRIVISLSFLRNALGVQQVPPNTVLVGIALFLTLFIMSPVIDDINQNAYTPYKNEEITQQEALDRATIPLKRFMLKETKIDALNLFLDASGTGRLENMSNQAMLEALPMRVVIPAFMTSELEQAFIIGFLLFIPFMLIDIAVSSALMSMGMIMLPPAMISLPFKLLLFITVNGWQLLFTTLIQGFL